MKTKFYRLKKTDTGWAVVTRTGEVIAQFGHERDGKREARRFRGVKNKVAEARHA